MMFGWTSITCREEFGIEEISRIVISLSVGIFAMISSAWMIKMAKTLHSSGNVFKIDETIGKGGAFISASHHAEREKFLFLSMILRTRLTVASLRIEEINQDRERFLECGDKSPHSKKAT